MRKVFAAIAVACVPCAVARADANDDRFLAAVHSVGITDHSADTLIGTAHGICEEFDQGVSLQQQTREILSVGRIQPGDSLSNSTNVGVLIAAAVAVYCPQYRSLIR